VFDALINELNSYLSFKDFSIREIFHVKKLSGEVIPLIGTEGGVYNTVYENIIMDEGYGVKLFRNGELLPENALAINGEVLDMLFGPIDYKIKIQPIDHSSSSIFNQPDLYKRYQIDVSDPRRTIISHSFLFYHRMDNIFIPEMTEEEIFDSGLTEFFLIEELMEHIIQEAYPHKVRNALIEQIGKEWNLFYTASKATSTATTSVTPSWSYSHGWSHSSAGSYLSSQYAHFN
jgi:hypothetical protein